MIFVSALSDTDIIRAIKEDKIDGTCGTYEQVNVRIRPRCVLKPEERNRMRGTGLD
jgi:hypothetical protein